MKHVIYGMNGNEDFAVSMKRAEYNGTYIKFMKEYG